MDQHWRHAGQRELSLSGGTVRPLIQMCHTFSQFEGLKFS